MKRMLAALMALVLALSCTAALAAPGDTFLFTRDPDAMRSSYVTQATAVGNTLYMIVRESKEDGSSSSSIYRYVQGQEGEAEMVAANVMNSDDYGDDLEYAQQEAERLGLDLAKAVGTLFSDGETLYTFDKLNGAIARLSFEGGEMGYEAVCKVDMEPLYVKEGDYQYLPSLQGGFLQDGRLYFSQNRWEVDHEVNTLWEINLADGNARSMELPRRVDRMTAYQPGKALAFLGSFWDEKAEKSNPPVLGTVDLASGAISTLQELEENVNIGSLAYQAANDTLYYEWDGVIWSMPGMGKAAKLVYTNLGYINGMALLDGGFCAVWSSDGMEIRNMDPAYMPTKVLNIAGGWRNEAALAFQQANPNVPLVFKNDYYSDITELGTAMLTGDESVDIINYSVSNGFDTLLEKGYCADLSSSEKLMNFAKRLYPAVQDEIMKDGKLYAIPVSFYGWTMAYQPARLKEAGITAEDLPTNLIDLCAFMTEWNDKWGDDGEDVNHTMPICTANSRRAIFDMMMNSYVDYYDATNQPLNFDTPLFREMLAALDAMDTSNMDLGDKPSDEAYDEFYQTYSGLLNGDMGMLNSGAVNEESWHVHPLALSKDTEAYVGGEMEVMFINPRTPNMAEAIQLLENYVDALDDLSRIVLCSDANEPVANSYYEEMVQGWERELAEAQEALAKADESEKRMWEEQITYIEELMANKEDYRWDYSEESIRMYREKIGDHMFVRHSNPLYSTNTETNGQIQSLQDRYVQRQMPAEQFIRELNQKVRMMVLEDQ